MSTAQTYRYKLIIEYDGTPFVGWQMQKNGPSIQEALARAIKGFCGQEIIPQGAGRTDAGVHASGQTAHLDLPRAYEARTVRDAINQHLKPAPISVLSAEPVSSDFDARFSARKRHYKYHIVNRRAPLALLNKRAWLIFVDLDAETMHEAAQTILGRHDFTTFRSISCQAKSPVKTLDQLDVRREGENIYISCSARSFMHNQVRSMVGSLTMVGRGKWPISQMRQALDSRDRAQCGPVAPAHGLYLAQVDYPDKKPAKM